MDRKTVYIETSIVSYLTARPSSNLLAAAWQKVTIDWWDTQRQRFNLYVSATVIEEAKKGIYEINGYFCPEICTPQELMGVSTDD
jgi:hypothetical protein